jgi:nanoRNase/pAp phosphatase (c-di-AMP/oligoRNAs hydrolase)
VPDQKYRLVTRADFDGVVCGALLKEREMINDVLFAEPKDMQAGRIPVTNQDITTNLPYVEGVHLCFDHHVSETVRVGARPNRIIDPDAPSAARVVYNHFGGKKGFPEISGELLEAVDKADSAQYTEEDILAPDGWTMLNFIVDPRTGFARFDKFAIPNDQLTVDLMTYCRHHPVKEILELPDVQARVHLYLAHEEKAELQIRRCAKVEGGVVVVDFRQEKEIFLANRFFVYALYPECAVSLYLFRDGTSDMTMLAAAKSILKRTFKANIGLLMLEHGGGGHEGAGTCRIPDARVDAVCAGLTRQINEIR